MANKLFLSRFTAAKAYQASVNNVSYERISDFAFAIILSFNMTNIPVTESFQFTNETYTEIDNAVNDLLSRILGIPNSNLFKFPPTTFTNVSNVIHASVVYRFKDGDIQVPSDFLNGILNTYNPTSPAPTSVTPTAPPLTRMGRALLFIRLEFNTTKPAPAEDAILKLANELFLQRFKAQRAYQVAVSNVSYERISDYAFAIILSFNMTNIPVTESFQFTNETYTEIDNSVNNLLSKILGTPNSSLFTFPPVTFNNVSNVIHASVVYRFEDGDIQVPSDFLTAVLNCVLCQC
nr:PREDICTED: uncharacterized protein LOC102684124 [Lepisosteus oculatus]